ncbi:MAG TPA: NAD-dependent epimerase/dehydratase family protein [Terrimicrobiaceae bacterium]
MTTDRASSKRLHTILGAGGAVARELTRELLAAGESVRLVSRRQTSQAGVAESKNANVSDYAQALEAVSGSAIVYLCVGLKYDIKIWRELWPKIMQNTIEACKAHNARLVFFDNVYMYGRVNGPMSEETPYNPCSKKGELRAQIATRLMEEVRAGNLTAMIARAADFYGPACATSILNLLVIDRLAVGKKAWWLGSTRTKHSFTFTPDIGKALVRLALEDQAYQQIWHLPTAQPAPTGREWLDLCAEATGKMPRHLILSGPIVKFMGLFDSNVREIYEMLYQNNEDYIFNSSKIERAFGINATPVREGIAQVVAPVHSTRTSRSR